MLRKLMKYELKSTARMFIPFYIALFVIAGINKLFFSVNHSYTTFFAFSKSFTVFAYVLIIICVFVLTFAVMIQRFYKNLLGDEGYLMHTLPVKPYKHILSKGIISIFWLIISIIVTVASLCILAIGTGLIPSIFDYIGKTSNYLWFLSPNLRVNIIITFVQAIIFVIVAVITEILRFYAAMSLGQLFSKHKLIASFGAYIILNMITQFINTIFAIFSIKIAESIDFASLPARSLVFSNYAHICLGVLTLLVLLYGAGFYITTHFILKKKLNLD